MPHPKHPAMLNLLAASAVENVPVDVSVLRAELAACAPSLVPTDDVEAFRQELNALDLEELQELLVLARASRALGVSAEIVAALATDETGQSEQAPSAT